MITVSLCEIKLLYLSGEYAKVTLQEGQPKQVESTLLDNGLCGFLLPYLTKGSIISKCIYIRRGISLLPHKEDL